ncbi:MAG: metallophosphoesterase family protein [Candidatus Longimicrobiales bacterium M2_2A_002]
MLIAHLADLHLGYRAYHRLAPGGMNQRERDVAGAAAAAIDQVVEAGPDLVLVAGDVFHTVRPSNSAIMDGFRQFMRLRAGLPDVPVVMIAGNHDSPRSVDTGSILRLLSEIPDVHVVDDGAEHVRLDALDASVLCLPHAALMGDEPPTIEPDGDAAANILMLHGTLSGAGIDAELLRMVEYGGAHLDRSELNEEAWDYIALGHYHNALRIGPNIWYAGATERTATNIWAEADTRKGWVLYDTGTRSGELRDIPTREVVDLPRFSARRWRAAESAEGAERTEDVWLSAEEIDRRIADAVADLPGGVEGKIVRLVITDVPRDLFRELDHRQVRELKAEALHFHLDARRPEVRERVTTEEVRRRTLEEELEAFLKDWEPTTPGIDRDRLLEVGAKYLEATEDWREAVPELPLEEDGSVPGARASGEEAS